LIAEFLEKDEGSKGVNTFLENAFRDDAFLLRFLIGRKYRPKHAFETVGV